MDILRLVTMILNLVTLILNLKVLNYMLKLNKEIKENKIIKG